MTTPQTPADTPDAVKENTRRECLKCHTSWSGPGNLPMECPACKSRTVKTGWPKQPTTVPEKHGLSENLIVCVAPNDLKTCPRCGPDACTGNHSDVPDVVAEVEKALAQFDDNDNTEPNCLMDEVPLPVVRWLRALVQRVKAAEDELEAQFRYGYRLGLSRGTNDETEDDVVRLWKHKRVTEQGAFQKTRWGMTNKELCEILHSDVERWLTEEEAEVLREAATRIEQLASAHAQVVAERDTYQHISDDYVRVMAERDAAEGSLSGCRNANEELLHKAEAAEQERDTLTRTLAAMDKQRISMGETIRQGMEHGEVFVAEIKRLRTDLAAAQQRWEKLKAKLNCREYSAYVTLNEARDLMADLERGAEGGPQ